MVIKKYEAVHRAGVLELLRLNTPKYFSPDERQDLIDYLDNHLEYYYVVESENQVMGCGGLNLSDEPEVIRISWDIIHPESQGRGLGKELTRFRMERIQEIPGIKMVSVRTSQLAYKFYEKLGFELKEVVKDFWAEGYDMYRMECPVGSFIWNN
jgi:ribosomal-protein-alanine N-acetyltransferase